MNKRLVTCLVIVMIICLSGCGISGKEVFHRFDPYTFEIIEDVEKEESNEESFNIVSSKELTADELKQVFEKLFKANRWKEGHGSLFVDWGDYLEIDNRYYYHIDNADISSPDEVYSLIGDAYSEKILNEFIDLNLFYVKDGKLYIETGGMGGVPPIAKTCTATKKDDGSYLVSIHLVSSFDDETFDESYRLIYENGKWVFDEFVPTEIRDYHECEYYVE